MAANDVVSSPLHSHLVPCLLKPLCDLLISFYIDEQIWLPPTLHKALESIKSIIISSLEQKSIPVVSWWSHLHSLILESHLANEMEKILSRYGLIIGPSGSSHSYPLEDDDDLFEKFDSCRSKSPDDCTYTQWGNAEVS